MAESFLTHGADEMIGGDRNQIIVHVSAATEGNPMRKTCGEKTAGCCEIEHGPSVSAETCRRLACDASMVGIVENENGDPLNVWRKTRTISAPFRRALNAR